MIIVDEIKALLKFRSVAKDVVSEGKQMNGTKPGWKTTEFWVKIATVDLPMLWAVVHGFIPAKYALAIETAAVAIYTICRTAAKAVADIQSGQTA